MLIIHPAFLFAFFPLSLLFYALCTHPKKKTCLFLICLCYHFLLNLSHPLNMLYPLLLVFYTYGGAQLLSKIKKRSLCILLCILPCLAVMVSRIFLYAKVPEFTYPIGFMIMVLCSVSCLISVYRESPGCSTRLWEIARYLLFFPTMIIGPVIRYPDFQRITQENAICFDLKTVASGARLLMIGFIKRIAVGGVLFETFQLFSTLSHDAPNMIFGVFLLVLMYFSTFFMISGYVDMAVGISRMYGIVLFENSANPFAVYTPEVYLTSLFGSLNDWLSDYVSESLGARLSQKRQALLYAFIQTLFILLLIRSTAGVLLAALPLILLNCLFYIFDLKQKIRKSSGLRFLFTCFTMCIVSFFWMFLLLETPSDIFSYIGGITHDNPEYRTNLILSTFSGVKYLFVILMGGLTLYWRSEESKLMPEKGTGATPTILYTVSSVLLLFLFLFTVLFFLPHFFTEGSTTVFFPRLAFNI